MRVMTKSNFEKLIRRKMITFGDLQEGQSFFFFGPKGASVLEFMFRSRFYLLVFNDPTKEAGEK